MTDGNTMVLTGKSFYTVGYSVKATYREISATKVVVDSAT